jgi:diadenosine tetraphosphate (Ap4A) HIT family hydrolase
MPKDEWLYLMEKVQTIAQAVSKSTHAIRMYIASLGSPERNAHVHIHVCPCPPGTPLEKQQFEAMQFHADSYMKLSDERMQKLAANIKAHIE